MLKWFFIALLTTGCATATADLPSIAMDQGNPCKYKIVTKHMSVSGSPEFVTAAVVQAQKEVSEQITYMQLYCSQIEAQERAVSISHGSPYAKYSRQELEDALKRVSVLYLNLRKLTLDLIEKSNKLDAVCGDRSAPDDSRARFEEINRDFKNTQ